MRPRPGGGAVPIVAAEPATLLERAAAEPAPRERRYDGPLDLDLGRILLVHRVENIPPPPDFIFTPFVSSRRHAANALDVGRSDVTSGVVSDLATSEVPLSEAVVAALAANPSAGGVCAALVPTPIDPQPCRTVDEREACRRVDRGWRVDVAPCLNVGASGEAFRARVRRRGISTARALPSSPAVPSPIELEAASA